MDVNGTMNSIVGNSQEELTEQLNLIGVSYKLFAIVPQGSRFVAFYQIKEENKQAPKLKLIKKKEA